ncbi:MAG: hypothetical protein ABSA47_12310 [Verrucomicrobiota bacterium]
MRLSSQPMSPEAALDALVSTNRSERLNAVRALNTPRVQLAARLMAILNSTNSDAVKVDAVIVAGQEHIDQAIPWLVRHFNLDDVYPRQMSYMGSLRGIGEALLESESVSGALWKIGLPAIPALLDRIAETDETNITAKCVLVCYRIEGRDLTQFRLQQFADLATDQKTRDRIQSAIGILKNLSARSIGTTGVPEWLDDVAEENNPDFIVSTCASVQGCEMTLFQLQRLLEKETDPNRKARIQSALDYLQESSPLARPGEAAPKPVPAAVGQPLVQPAPGEIPMISYNFHGLSLQELLSIYEHLTGEKVTIKVMPNPAPVMRVYTEAPVTKSQARQVLEEALKQEAGLVIVRGADGSLSAVPNPEDVR